MSSRHAFAYVLATALIAVTAALLHPLLDAQPPGGPATQGTGSSGSSVQGR